MRKDRIVPQEEQEFLNHYSPKDYDRPSVTADILVFSMIDKKLHILLIKRKGHPYKDYWAIPGGFVGINESVEDAAYRELKEETNIDNAYLEQLYTFGNPNRDPRMRVISVAYIALVSASKMKESAGDDASEVCWFPVNDLLEQLETEDILAFDHEEILHTAISRLRGKIHYTDIAFQLLPKEFTMRELMEVYEEILNTKLRLTNIIRDTAPRLIFTGEYRKNDVVHCRPSKVYTFNKDYFKKY